jgi:hypothetical protein
MDLIINFIEIPILSQHVQNGCHLTLLMTKEPCLKLCLYNKSQNSEYFHVRHASFASEIDGRI